MKFAILAIMLGFATLFIDGCQKCQRPCPKPCPCPSCPCPPDCPNGPPEGCPDGKCPRK